MSQQQQNNQNSKNVYVPSEVKKPWYLTEEMMSRRITCEKRPMSLSKKEKREYRARMIPMPITTLEEYNEYQKIRLPPKEEKYPWNKNACNTSGGGAGTSGEAALDKYREILKDEVVPQSAIDDWKNREGGWDNMH
uniref:Uncharacterized protein n=2 Tax=Meloidogyne TaxID=189290 RepID=A0A6V7X9P0_MELEN|nr:unnamed protein product [Meloidogyne enterolobii]CAD2196056.1 unnamed protein product [Meloidogyne enterolobii]